MPDVREYVWNIDSNIFYHITDLDGNYRKLTINKLSGEVLFDDYVHNKIDICRAIITTTPLPKLSKNMYEFRRLFRKLIKESELASDTLNSLLENEMRVVDIVKKRFF